MATPPPLPQNRSHTPVGVPVVTLPQSQSSSLQPGEARLEIPDFRGGSGRIKLTIPMVLIVSALSAMGARLIPTQTSTDISIAEAKVKAEIEAQKQSQFREDLNRQIQSLQTEMGKLHDSCNNQLIRMDERLKSVERKTGN